jgi:TrmH family RNA methyltransferase
MKHIHSRDNSQFKRLLLLAQSGRKLNQAGLMLLDGTHLLETARDASIEFTVLAIGASALEIPEQCSLFDSITAEEKILLPDHLLSLLSPVTTATGLVGIAKVPARNGMLRSSTTCLLLEGIQDPGNLGTILRTAAAAGVKDIALSTGCASAWGAKVLRAGMGAHFRLSIQEDVNLPELAGQLLTTKIATAPQASQSVYETSLAMPVAWLFGGEGAGLSARLLETADQTISIPMPGHTESLNVAAAVAVCLFEQVRQQSNPVLLSG